MTDNLSKEIRKKNMKAIRSSNTKIEVEVCRELWRKGYRFRKNVSDLIGKPDIAIKKYKVVIFLDSCFWHCCPLHRTFPKSNTEYWHAKLKYNQYRDVKVNKYYSENGWYILRIWEHEIKEDLEKVIKRICDFIDFAKTNH